ncbi:lysine N(6)-hydroxylase/L-ornithine N(5)-oxygenase family protein [Nocardia sp. CA2R105]|uniref:SidA/IucD/PvdA family monooxygenase n=1 Tax=Nocardia coffeae TaxID=2873381 RepID=UPI001CA69729|nr:SidA/IucD/PvdA family monooxygenase [Nocardia coffeae]MBY8863521.1 lysine N(6)-hydroxylase/L-ornithine N(5)-oxygenase family protein [Nocardia coffeae]
MATVEHAPMQPVLGIGFGPANLSTAIAAQDNGLLEHCHFIERAPEFEWQSEQMLTGADIQNNPFRDLVMPRDPGHEYTFVRYLHGRGVLTDYLHYNAKFALRNEYAGYLQWVASHFADRVTYGQEVRAVEVVQRHGGECFEVRTAERMWHARHLIVGTGRTPNVPGCFAIDSPRIFHAGRYLSTMRRLAQERVELRTVAVVGSSQSAIEIILDLLARPDVGRVVSIQRGIGFRLKDTSPFSRRVFLPEFIDYFHPLPLETKKRLREQLRAVNYGACDQDVIDQLTTVQRDYEHRGSDRFTLMPFSQVRTVVGQGDGALLLTLADVNNGDTASLGVDAVVLATGYRDFGTGPDDELSHPLLRSVRHRIACEADGTPVVHRDYSLEFASAEGSLSVYLNGVCEASHGMGDAGALAVLSARANDIAESMRARLRADAFEQPVPARNGLLSVS